MRIGGALFVIFLMFRRRMMVACWTTTVPHQRARRLLVLSPPLCRIPLPSQTTSRSKRQTILVRCFATTKKAASASNNLLSEEHDRNIYNKLEWVATELRKHDALYYGEDGTNNNNMIVVAMTQQQNREFRMMNTMPWRHKKPSCVEGTQKFGNATKRNRGWVWQRRGIKVEWGV